MRWMIALFLLFGFAAVWAEEKVTGASPDGKFALLVDQNPDNEQIESVALVALPSKRVLHWLIDTGTAPTSFSVLWSEDSRYFAFTESEPRVAWTVLWRLDSKGEWHRIPVPEITLPFEKEYPPGAVRGLADFVEPIQWLPGGALRVRRSGRDAVTPESGDLYWVDYDYHATLSPGPNGDMQVSDLEKISLERETE